MKTGSNATPAPAPASTAPAANVNTTMRFWACFVVCLVALGLVSGLLLTGFFLMMGYRVF